MAIYARSDLASVTVSPEAHGGCGKAHHRPASDGVPEAVWRLECPPCEDFLRHDPLWSPTIAEIPETHDERRSREDLEKRGERSSRDLTALMLARIAGDTTAESTITQLMGMHTRADKPSLCPEGHQNPASARFCTECGRKVTPAGTVLCPGGHTSPAGSRFCVECGQPTAAAIPVHETAGGGHAVPPLDEAHAPPGAVPAAPPPPGPEPRRAAGSAPPMSVTGAAEPTSREIRDMKRDGLVALAKRRGLPDTGSRADLIARLVKKASGT